MRRRNVIIAAVIAVIVVVAVALIWFQPQKLVIDERVDETAPPVATAAGASVLGTGTFKPLDHEAEGTASLIRSGNETVLRFEDFSVENGPDLVVYLSSGDPNGPGRALGEDVVDLGRLKGNVGSQNYTVPKGTDLDRYDTAVVWCRRFTVAFAAAEIA